MMILVERIEFGHTLEQFELTDVSEEEILIAAKLATILESLFEIEIADADKNYLLLQIASKRILNVEDKEISEFDDYAYIEGLLNRIESHYFYHLQDDMQLKKDLVAHIHSMLYRVKYHMTVKKPNDGAHQALLSVSLRNHARRSRIAKKTIHMTLIKMN